MRAIARIAAGIVLVLIGIVGLILPIMPGWVFIIPGLILLSEYFPPIKRLLDWAKTKVEAHDSRGYFRKWSSKGTPEAGEPTEPNPPAA